MTTARVAQASLQKLKIHVSRSPPRSTEQPKFPGENNMTVNQGNYSNQYQVEDFVVVKYCAQQYPGKIILLDGEKICINNFEKKNANFGHI